MGQSIKGDGLKERWEEDGGEGRKEGSTVRTHAEAEVLFLSSVSPLCRFNPQVHFWNRSPPSHPLRATRPLGDGSVVAAVVYGAAFPA